MPNDYFRFKQFTVRQDRCAMKVGTDGVLLGAWADVSGAEYILDIGTGTGLVALMLAQRCTAQIDAIEIDMEAAQQALENVLSSPWSYRISVTAISFQSFVLPEKKYDLIVANPPYFKNSLSSPGQLRSLARHNHTLNPDDLFSGVSVLLSERGRFAIIYPTSDIMSLIKIAAGSGLYLSRKTEIIPSPGKNSKRTLAEFTFEPSEVKTSELVLEKYGRHGYSEDYLKLTRDYYL